jgi:hypothetical protein
LEQESRETETDNLCHKEAHRAQRQLLSAQLAAWRGSDDIETRAKRANLAEFDRIMAKVPKAPPMPGDELPPGYRSPLPE